MPSGQYPSPVGSDFDQHVYGLRLSYDLDGKRTALVHPSTIRPGSLDQVYQYVTATGELQWVKDVLGNQVSFGYDDVGRLTGIGFPGGWSDARAYDADGRMSQRTVTHFGTDRLRYDARGRVIAGTLDPGQRSMGIWYTGLGAVAVADGRTEASSGGMEEFTTDPIGNRLWQRQLGIHPNAPDQDGERDQTVDSQGRLTAIRSRPDPVYNYYFAEDYWYDQAGNTDLNFGDRNEGGALHSDQSKSYYAADQKLRVRNRHNGLSSTSNPDGVFEEYRYDALGRRVLVRSRPTALGSSYDPSAWNPCPSECLKGYIERTVWDTDQILYEIRAKGATGVPASTMESDSPTSTSAEGYRFGRVMYTHGAGIDQPLLLARMGLSGQTDPHVLSLHADWQGQYRGGSYMDGTACTAAAGCTLVDWPAARTTVDGGLTQKSQGGWFGNLVTQKTDGSGLQYMRNRYYDPKTGRFTQADPIGLAGGLNAYGFAEGDPVNFSDPFGLCPKEKPLCQWIKAALIAAGTDIGGMLGGGAGLLAGPGALVASPAGALTGMAAGAAIGAAAGSLVDHVFFSDADPVRGGKSSSEYDRHIDGRNSAQDQLRQLEEKLSQTKGPKAQQPIREQIERLRREVKGHEKEIRQKWPDGRPE